MMSIKELAALAEELKALQLLIEKTMESRSRKVLQQRAWILLKRVERRGE